MWKKVAKRAIHAERIQGEDEMRMLAFGNNVIVNDNARKGGFAPSQWVLGKFPRSVGNVFDADEWADIGLQQEKVDPHSAFNRLARIRLACQEGHAQVDCSRKVAAVTCRKAAPLPGNYKVGDLVSFKREAGSHGDPEEKWSSATRIIGFE